MSILVVSDLHLGSRARGDIAREAAIREPLLRAAEEADEMVLLGDTLEMRERPLEAAMAAAEDFFRDLGDAMAGKRITLVPGNHDHHFIRPWLDRRSPQDKSLGLEQRIAPAQASAQAGRAAAWLGAARLEVAYPGVWLRPDVYAMHGHHLDLHNPVPSFEVLALRAVQRYGRRGASGPDGYEEVFGPVFEVTFRAAQKSGHGPPNGAIRPDASHRAWQFMTSDRNSLGQRLVVKAAVPAAVQGLRLAGLGPLDPEMSGAALRRAALDAMGAVVDDLGIAADHVIFAHTHRAGPMPFDDPAPWRTPSGASLHNDGSWVYDRVFLRPGGPDVNPYWPGRCLVVGEAGAPEMRGLLDDFDREELDVAGGPGRADSAPSPRQ